ncbi:l-Fucosyltransferase [Trichonephila clavipes]|nr:l-Fucosyltransferase [Trichonephila clavipes]
MPQSCFCFTARDRSDSWYDGMGSLCLPYTVTSSIDPCHHMTALRYVHDILQPHVLPLSQQLPDAIFQQDNARPHTAKVYQDGVHNVTTLPLTAQSPDLSPIEHI